MKRLATIGVYGFTAGAFLTELREADVRLLIDVRQRRGVRGSEYAWANARRLQAALADAGVEYRHHKELAPTTELRHLQYQEDDRLGVGKRSRVELAPAYRERYIKEILDGVDLAPIVAEMPADGVVGAVLRRARSRACHRSLIAERIVAEMGCPWCTFAPREPRSGCGPTRSGKACRLTESRVRSADGRPGRDAQRSCQPWQTM